MLTSYLKMKQHGGSYVSTFWLKLLLHVADLVNMVNILHV